MTSRATPLVLFGYLLATACAPSTGDDAGAPDAGGSSDAGTVTDAGPHVDAGADADGGSSGDAGSQHDAGAEEDAGPFEIDADAVPGERCAPEERIALIEVSTWGGGTYSATASLFDAPPPWFGPPALSDAACAFYDGASGCSCGVDQVCAFGGGCAPRPSPVSGVSLRLVAGAEEQLLEEGEVPGRVEGAITLPGSSFSLELSADGVVVRAAAMTVPDALTNAQGDLHGTYDAPTGIDLSWDAPPAGVDAFTHIPINHHVGTPTFTECSVDGAAGAMSVPGDMLTPLAVSTGLEFQTLDAARFAAATTEHGCIEVRFSMRQLMSLE